MKKHILILLVPLCMLLMLAGCYKLQEDYNRKPHIISPNTGLTAWQYLNTRNYLKVVDTIIINDTTKKIDTVTIRNLDLLQTNVATAILNARNVTAAKPSFPTGATVSTTVRVVKVDTIFTLMLRMIRASGIDTSLYTQTNTKRTFILLHQDAIRRLNSTKTIYNDCFIGANLINGICGTVNSSKVFVANKFASFPQIYLQNYLKWLILDGVYNHYTLQTINSEVNTLCPAGYWSTLPANITIPGTSATNALWTLGSLTIPAFGVGLNPNSTMKIRVLDSSPSNTSDYPIILNSSVNVRTSSILLTNGTAHVIDRYFTTNIPTIDF
ncbi:MAG: hypothetical protein Q8908_06310 [Bacteroidota bacterium]|nr:hypothetical protein [Bacteroidota bacterium]